MKHDGKPFFQPLWLYANKLSFVILLTTPVLVSLFSLRFIASNQIWLIMSKEYDLIVAGGGIAGTTVVEKMSELCPNSTIGWFSPSFLYKRVKSVTKHGRFLETVQVEETIDPQIIKDNPNIKCERVKIGQIDPSSKTISDESNQQLTWKYKYLCLCTGAVPVKIPGTGSDPNVVEVRDTATIDTLEEKIKSSSTVMIVGNGGIATELVHKLNNVTIIWAIRDSSISSVFFDPPAGQFLLQSSSSFSSSPGDSRDEFKTDGDQAEPVATLLNSSGSSRLQEENQTGPGKGHVFLESSSFSTVTTPITGISQDEGVTSRMENHPFYDGNFPIGSSLGPDWSSNRSFTGLKPGPKTVIIESECEVKQVLNHRIEGERDRKAESNKGDKQESLNTSFVTPNYTIELTNGKKYSCDLIISATGVRPNVPPGWKSLFTISPEGGIVVNESMSTSVDSVYAAGDVCTVNWDHLKQDNCHWFQMKLWTQAMHLANYTSYCIAKNFDRTIDPKFHFNFDLFTHVTSFFGYKVILIGLYNGQGLNNDYKMLLSIKEKQSYAKVIVKDGKVKGALLIGDTDLEETIENLILSQMDISTIEDHLLDGTVDIEDYFD